MAFRLLVGGLVLLGLVFGVELYLREGGFSEPARHLLVERLGKALGGEVAVEQVRLSILPPTLIARGVRLPPKGPAFEGGTVDEVRVRLSLASILTGGLTALDVRAVGPDLRFQVPPKAPGAAPEAAIPDLGPAGSHHLQVSGGHVTVRVGASVVVFNSVSLTGAPNVTLRRYSLELTGGEVELNGTPVLDSAELDAALEPDRIRVRRIALEGDAGRLEATGEVRPAEAGEGTGPYLTFGTTFSGDAAPALDLAARLGAAPLGLSGRVRAEGRLYGTLSRPHWEGEAGGTNLVLAGNPRKVKSLEARLRAGDGVVEAVHVKAEAGGGELRGDGSVTLATPLAYEARVRGDDVGLAWLLGSDLPLGRLSGEVHVKGERGGHPRGTVQWRYQNPSAAAAPEEDGAPLWERVGVRLAEGQGTARLDPDGTQTHEFSAATAGSRLTASVTVGPDAALSGKVQVKADDFAELGSLFGLDYVHGAADGGGTVTGTLAAWRVEGTAHLMDGAVRDLKVARLVGDVVLEPHRIAFSNVRTGGDGGLRLAGELHLPDPARGETELGAALALSVYSVPLWEVMGLVHPQERLDLRFPVSGHLNLVKGPAGLFTWAHVRAGAGSLYGQRIASGDARLWVDPEGLTLTDAVFRLPGAGAPAAVVASGSLVGGGEAGPVVRADGSLRFEGGAYRVEGRTDGLPLSAVDILAEQVPFLAGSFDGTARLTGDFQDPHLHLEGTLRDAAFHGAAVGQGPMVLDLSAWQLRLRGSLLAPAGRPGRAHFVFVSRLKAPLSFAVAARVDQADAVPWMRGLMPETDALARAQLGDDYGLTADGAVAAAGRFDRGPARVLVKASGARLTVRGQQARLAGPARIELKDGAVSLSDVSLKAPGLDLAVAGTLRPGERYDLKVGGTVAASWLALVRPAYGFAGGAADLDLAVAGPWAAPRVRGVVSPRALVVAPPPLEPAATSFTLDGRIAVDGPLADPPSGDVDARLAPFTVDLAGNRLAAPEVRLAASAGSYRLTGVELAGQAGQVRVEGGWDYGRRVALKAVGTVDVAVLVRQVPGVSQASGRAAVSADVIGPWEGPKVRAGATLEGGRVRIDPLQQVLEVDTASVLYTDGKVVIDALEGHLAGAPFSVEGSYDPASREVRLAMTVDGYPFRSFPGLTGILDGELLLAGRLPAPTLSGDLHVRKALYDRPTQWGSWLVDSVTAGKAEVARVIPMGDVRLAVRVYGDEDIEVDNNLAKLVLDMDLAVGGSLQEPGLVGRIDVRQGEAYFRDRTFTVVSASVDFVQPGRIEPYVDVVARTTVDHSLPDDPLHTETVDIDLSLTGPLEKLQLTLTSRPDLPQEDLLSLLALGRTTQDLAASGTGVGAGEAAYLATAPLQTQLEAQVHRFTGLDQFQLEPYYYASTDTTSTSTTTSARLTVGKKLLEGRGLVIYSAPLDAAQAPQVQLSYRLSTITSVLLEQDELGRVGGEFRFRFRFR